MRSFHHRLRSLAALALLAGAAAADDPPNIVLFLVDDMGWQDTSVPFHSEATPFNERYETPNMERLAAGGMRFTRAYAHCVCSPSRVSLMTGANPARHRVTNWTLREGVAQDAGHPNLEMPAWNVNGLSNDPETPRAISSPALPALLRAAGYRTLHVGKAHFGAMGTPGADPKNLGFDENVAGHAAGGPGSYHGRNDFSAAWRDGSRVWDVPGLEQYHGEDVFLTEALSLEACRLVEQAARDGQRFFLYLSHYAIHAPIEEDARYAPKYREAGLPDVEARYAALIEGMDRSLGMVLDELEEHGLADSTLVLFMSDNGGLSAHARAGEAHTHNAPLSSGKGSAHEGGVRVPMLARWPGVVEPGSSCAAIVQIDDFFPTLIEVAGAEGGNGSVDGRSFTPLLRGGELPARRLYWHYPNHWGPRGPGIGPHSAVLEGDLKLIYYWDGPRFELFDLAADLGEKRNLAESEPKVRDALAAHLGSFLRGVDAQRPTAKESGETVPWPDAE